MRPEDLRFWLQTAPFRPFRLHLNSGKSYDIRHPEMVKVGRSTLVVFSHRGDADDPFEWAEMISLVLIERIEPLENSAVA